MSLEALRSVKRLKSGKRMVAGGSGTLEALKPGPGKGVKRQQTNGGCGRLELEVLGTGA